MSPVPIDDALSKKIANMGLVCAVLVVFRHIWFEPCPYGWQWWLYQAIANNGISSAAVPLFFVISGFLLAGKMAGAGWWKCEVKKRTKSLLIPFVFWNLMFWSMAIVLYATAKFHGSREAILHVSSLGVALGLSILDFPVHKHLWFVRCLLLLVFVSPILIVMKRRLAVMLPLIIMVVRIMVTGCVDSSDLWDVYFNLSGYLQGLQFFSIGIWLRYNSLKYDGCRFVCLVSFLIASFFLILSVTTSSVGIQHVLAQVLEPIWIIVLWTGLPAVRIGKGWTSFSFPLYVVHGIVLIFWPYVFKLTDSRGFVDHSLAAYLFQVVALIFVSKVFVSIFRYCFPKLAAISFGGRC